MKQKIEELLQKNPLSKLFYTMASGISLGAIFSSPGGVDHLLNMLSLAAQNEITRYGFLFAVAAFLHSGRVKKEIRENFVGLKNAIDGVSMALRDDLKKHGDRLEKNSERLDKIDLRVTNLEGTKQPIMVSEIKETANA